MLVATHWKILNQLAECFNYGLFSLQVAIKAATRANTVCDYRKGDLPRKIIGNPVHIFVVHLYNTVVKMIIVAPNIQMYPKDSFPIHSC